MIGYKFDIEKIAKERKVFAQAFKETSDRFQEEIRELSLMTRISDTMKGMPDIEDICVSAVTVVMDELFAERCTMVLVDRFTGNLVIKSSMGYKDEKCVYFKNGFYGNLLLVDMKVSELVVKHQEPVLLENLQRDFKFKSLTGYTNARSVLCVPISTHGKVLGTLILSHSESGVFTRDEMRVLNNVSHQIAIALVNAYLNEDLVKTNQDLEKRISEKTRDLAHLYRESEKYAEKLEGKVEKKKKELDKTQKQLLKAKRLASVGQIVAMVSHEMRNPLGVIKNASYCLKKIIDTNDKEIMRQIKLIEREVMFSNNLISELQGFFKPIVSVKERADLNALVMESCEAANLPERITVIQRLQQDLPEIRVDENQIRQVVVNMLLNAFQSIEDEGEIVITTEIVNNGKGGKGKKTMKNHNQKREYIQMSISDTGCGIEQKQVSKLFEPFYSTKIKGIGLGLTVTRQIVEQHHGEIHIESTPGKGTMFRVLLPLKLQNGVTSSNIN